MGMCIFMSCFWHETPKKFRCFKSPIISEIMSTCVQSNAPFPLARFGQPGTAPHGSACCVLHFHRPAFAPLKGTPRGGAALKRCAAWLSPAEEGTKKVGTGTERTVMEMLSRAKSSQWKRGISVT
ncbi:hypothetical protein AMECASPLE_016090 [Ameca splendens]|uniref:Uncharacterized protein n=1 Tax=Ameca splendens TaxID=208324 RepID=A0ABV0XF42_9TELE